VLKHWTIHDNVTVCVFFVCMVMVTDFFAEDKASGVKFCKAFYQRPRHGISHFGELCFPRSPKLDKLARMNCPRCPCHGCPACIYVPGSHSRSVHEPRIGSACVDIWPSPKMDVLVSVLYMSEKLSGLDFVYSSCWCFVVAGIIFTTLLFIYSWGG